MPPEIAVYFSRDYPGAPFELFGVAHLFALALVLLANVSLLLLRRSESTAWRNGVRYGLAVVLVLNELAWHLWNWATGQWTIQTMLPLHLCSVLVWLSAWMLATRSYAIYEFAYFLGIGGAIQALLTPDAGVYGFPHFRFFQVIISHGAIVTAAVFMTLVERYRPTWRSLARVGLWGNLYMVAIFFLNRLIDSNYLFIAHKPETASLIDLLGPWPWYILVIEGIALVVFLLLYLPFALKDWRRARAGTQPA